MSRLRASLEGRRTKGEAVITADIGWPALLIGAALLVTVVACWIMEKKR